MRNSEMVSTCHVNLLSSPAAFHMHYTPERSISSPLLLICICPLLISLSFWLQTLTLQRWSESEASQVNFNTRFVFFYLKNVSHCLCLGSFDKNILTISSLWSSEVSIRVPLWQQSQSSDSDLCPWARYLLSLMTTLLYVRLSLSSGFCDA